MRSLFTRAVRAALALAVIAFGVAACGDDNGTNNTNPTTLVFVGVVNGDNGSLSGSITITVNGSAVTGEFDVVAPAAATHALTGTYTAGTRALTATGGGYSFGGVYDGVDRLEGTMSGAATGVFVAARDDNDSGLAFCGTFAGDDDGVFNFTIVGNELSGTATTSSGDVIPLDGTVSGNAITIRNPTGSGNLATGTRSGNAVSGTWSTGVNSGTWAGARCN